MPATTPQCFFENHDALVTYALSDPRLSHFKQTDIDALWNLARDANEAPVIDCLAQTINGFRFVIIKLDYVKRPLELTYYFAGYHEE
mgnify:CR=1 FL=1